MEQRAISNPFGASIYHIDETTSTMEEARRLTAASPSTSAISPLPSGSLHGTVIVADYQSGGRGRAAGRVWHAKSGESLLCTLILRYPTLQAMPAALPLRLGVAVALGMETLWPQLAGRTRVKWPNDVLIDGKKTCGILCEGEGPWLYAGMGINLLQRDFPAELSGRSISVLQALEQSGGMYARPERYQFLNKLLEHIKGLLEDSSGASEKQRWLTQLESRLFGRGEEVRFLAGSAEAPQPVTGTLEGVSPSGELLIRTRGSDRTEAYITGELDVYG